MTALSLLHSIFLGIVQGLAEFLPISSSGHLVLLQILFDINPPPFLFDIFLHLSTLLAVLFFFRKKILSLSSKDLIFLAAGSIPAFIIGYLIRDFIDIIFNSSLVVGLGLLLTAVFNFLTNHIFKTQDSKQKLNFQKSLLIGLSQALAFIPGISRSGSTIFTGAAIGLEKTQAFTYSFLLSIPVILGANAIQFQKILVSGIKDFNPLILLTGGIISFLTSIFSLKILKKIIKKEQYFYFGWYCLILGVVVIFFSLN